MAKRKKGQPGRRARQVEEIPVRAALVLESQNFVLIGLGLAALAVGYLLLARGSTVAAPLLLVLGYVVLIPLGLIRVRRRRNNGSMPAANEGA